MKRYKALWKKLPLWAALLFVLAGGQPRAAAGDELRSFNALALEVAVTKGLRERFFVEAGDKRGRGFSVTDYLDGPQFLTAYERMGGAAVLGYPASRPFVGKDGLMYQITQRTLLKWPDARNSTALANLYEIMQGEGLDEALLAQFVPRPLEGGGSFYADTRAERLSWLTNTAIETAYLRNPLVPGNIEASIELYGLPMSRPAEFGPFIVQRFQRIAFQHWFKDVPGGQPAGTVVPVNGGDMFKQLRHAGTRIATPHLAGEIEIVGSDLAIAPPFAAPNGLAEGFNTSEEAILRGLKALEPLSVAFEGLAAARALQTEIRFRNLPRQVLGVFSSRNTIELSGSLRNEEVRALAVVLLHELIHLADWRADRFGKDPQSCLEAEERAIVAEATAWGNLVGADGKRPALTQLERLENLRLRLLQDEDGRISEHASQLYSEVCAA